MMDRKYILGVAATSAVAAAVLAWLIMPDVYKGDRFIQASILIISANFAVSIVLTVFYAYIYSEVPSKFTLALLLVMLTLLLYSLTANPILHAACGFCVTNSGYLTIVPDIFAAAALWALAYISLE